MTSRVPSTSSSSVAGRSGTAASATASGSPGPASGGGTDAGDTALISWGSTSASEPSEPSHTMVNSAKNRAGRRIADGQPGAFQAAMRIACRIGWSAARHFTAPSACRVVTETPTSFRIEDEPRRRNGSTLITAANHRVKTERAAEAIIERAPNHTS